MFLVGPLKLLQRHSFLSKFSLHSSKNLSVTFCVLDIFPIGCNKGRDFVTH